MTDEPPAGPTAATPNGSTRGGITEETRAVIVAAEQQARELGHPVVATAHVLLGLVAEEARRGARDAVNADEDGHVDDTVPSPLVAAGVRLENVRAEVVRHTDHPELAGSPPTDRGVGRGWGDIELPATAHARAVLQQALRRATPQDDPPPAHDRQVITPAHLLLGVLDRPDTATRAALAGIGVDTVALTRDAERIAAAAPRLSATQPARTNPRLIPAHTSADGTTTFRIFGLPSRLVFTGPAARRVLAEAEAAGQLDLDKLIAAAESEAASRPSPGGPVTGWSSGRRDGA